MNIDFEDTIAAPATLPGTGAISIIRISGPDTFAVVDQLVSFKKGRAAEFKGNTIHFGTIYLDDGKPLDEVLVSVFRSPISYTGEDSAEISFHASKYIAGELMALITKAGARPAGPGEFTKRAYINGKLDLAQAESVADIISSQNAASHRLACNQLKGGFSKELLEMRSELLNMLSLMELELDFSEEDVEFADRSQLKALLEKVIGHTRSLAASFRLGNAIKNGIPVALAGAANSGKSTLLNALIGEERAIVSDIPGTTRDTIEEVFNIDGVAFRFIDTAGIRETSETIEKMGIERSLKKLSEADIVLGVIDGSASEERVLKEAKFIISKCDFSVQKLVLVLNKKDLFKGDEDLSRSGGFEGNCEFGSKNILADGSDLSKSRILDGRDDLSRSEVFERNCELVSKNIPVDGSDLSKSIILDGIDDLSRSEVFERNMSSKNSISEAQKAPNKNVSALNSFVLEIDKEDINKKIKIISISASKGEGIYELKKILAGFQESSLAGSDTNLVTNARHHAALVQAAGFLSKAQAGLESSLPTDLVAQELREAISSLSSITGMSIDTEEVLGNIFKNFCIGK